MSAMSGDAADDEIKNTRTLVCEAADRILIDNGEIPTTREVLARIGQGSHTTIASALKEWKQQLGDRLRQAETTPGLPPALARALVDAWRVVVDDQALRADEAWGQYRRLADQQIENAQTRQQTALAGQEAAQRRADDLAIKRDGLVERIRVLTDALHSAQARAAAAEARIDEYRATVERTIQQTEKQLAANAATLAVTQTRYDEMERRLTDQISEARGARERSEKTLQQKQEEWTRTRESLEQKILEVEKERVRQAAIIDRVNGEKIAATQHGAQCAARINVLVAEAKHNEQKIASGAAQATELRAGVENLKHEIKKRDLVIESLRDELKASGQVANDAKESQARLQGESDGLRAALAQQSRAVLDEQQRSPKS